MAAGVMLDDNGQQVGGGVVTSPTVYSYYGGQDYLAANPGSTAEIQDPRTGQWYPYVPGDPHDNGRGNIRITPAPAPTTPVVKTGGDLQTGTGNTYPEDPGYGVNPVPDDTPAPPPATGGGGGGGTGLINPWPGGDFVPPGYTPPPAFQSPTWQEAADDPGFQFVQQQGQQGVERSAAARGVLNSGGTLQDIAKWNQALAQTQYGNVYDRKLQNYQTNYGTQYMDPYKNAYQSAFDKYRVNYQAWLDRINNTINLNNQ